MLGQTLTSVIRVTMIGDINIPAGAAWPGPEPESKEIFR